MSEAAAPQARPRAWGCLLRVVVAGLILVAVGIGLSFAFNRGAKAPAPPATYDAGSAEGYPRAMVVPIEEAHAFLTRLADGCFIALYDKSPKQQELGGDCRVRFDPAAPTGSAKQLEGFTGAFVEDCDQNARSVWLADGSFAFGAGYPGVALDRFDTHIDAAGDVIIDLGSRTCTKSKGVAGVPPFVAAHCGAGG